MNKLLKFVYRFGGPILLVFAIVLYYQLSDFERHGGTYRSHVFIIWIYKALGLWGAVTTVLLASAGWFYLSIRHYVLKKNGKVVDGRNPSGMENMWS